MDKKELDQLIDKSILGRLSQDEKSKLNAYIMENPDIKSEIKMRADVMKGLEYNADQDFRSLLDKIHDEEILSSFKSSTKKSIMIVLIVLGAFLGIFLLLKYINSSSKNTPKPSPALYANYFKAFTPSVETRNPDNAQEAIYQNFIEAYRAKDYRRSLEIIRPVLDNSDNNALLLAGISAMQTDKIQEAIGYLDQIIKNNDFYFIDHAKWYKALALIKTNKLQEARILLEELADNPEADHHNESIAILEEI